MDIKKKKMTLSKDLIEDIATAMNDNSFEHKWYLDIQDEVTVILSDYDNDEQLSELVENEYGERFISIPVKDSHEGWEQMDRFIESLDDEKQTTRDWLYSAIEGKGAFSRFINTVYRLGLEERWFEFKGLEDSQEALEWLHSLELITSEDIATGMKLYEDLVSKRKQMEKDKTNMTRGATVICTTNVGHTDKLTPNKTYEVLDERKEHLLIRIKDDRDKECWLPKSHFELLHT
jgi:hypothetical protein